jgi:hormone-sensitive lipase
MVHLHGGGFVAMSSSMHQPYLVKWAKELEVPIFSIDYRLAPEVQYPNQLDDSINGYLWILFFVELVLKVKIKNLILTGDSAGGNLGYALINWCIVNGIRKPDFFFAHYPVVNFNFENWYTPSYLYAMDEPILNYATLKMCSKYYLPDNVDANNDAYCCI